MLLMALDHTIYFVVNQHPMEFFGDGNASYVFPQYDNYIQLLTRVVTHICAPSFFFLLGVAMVLYSNSKFVQGFSHQEVILHFIKRGLVLIVLQLTIINAAWYLGTINNDLIEVSFPSGGYGDVWISPDVISTLGISMILCAFIIHLSRKNILIISLLLFGFTQWFYPSGFLLNQLVHPILRLLMVPGQTNILLVNYPVLPWIPLVGFGIVFGKSLLTNVKKAFDMIKIIGSICLILFVILRIMRIGDDHPSSAHIIRWFSLTKYPPTIHYILFSLGLAFIFLWLVYELKQKFAYNRFDDILITFGQSSLFFYIIHLFIYACIGFMFTHITSYLLIYVLWIVGLIPSYIACKIYRNRISKRLNKKSRCL